jgi:lipopolysaccharide transport system ATP-binding protein
MTDTLIKVENLSKKFCRSLKKSLWYGMQDLGRELVGRRHGENRELRDSEFWAVKDVSFELKRGECLGLIGRNGAGKTTLLRMLNGLIKPDQGCVQIRGRVGALIALGAGFNPILTGRENIVVNASVLGVSQNQLNEKLDDIVGFAELGAFIDAPVQNYSSGMQIRLGFSIASAFEVDVLLLDEVLAVGDAAFRAKCFKRIGEVLNRAAVIFVSHNEAQVSRICDSALLLHRGQVEYLGETADALRRYRDNQEEPFRLSCSITDDRISGIEPIFLLEELTFGSDLECGFRLECRDSVTVGLALIHFANENGFIAHSQVSFSPDKPLRLEQGVHELHYVLGPVHLAHGKYQLSMSLFNATGKKTLAQLFDFACVDVVGPIGSGPAHLIPMSFRLIKGA